MIVSCTVLLLRVNICSYAQLLYHSFLLYRRSFMHISFILQAGKGRTGLMVCSYLVYCGMAAAEALQLYADRRTTNNQGVNCVTFYLRGQVLLTFLTEEPWIVYLFSDIRMCSSYCDLLLKHEKHETIPRVGKYFI